MRTKALWLAAAATMVMAHAAAASTVTVTYYGQLTNGTDDGGLFGAAGADMTGKAFTAVYTLNGDVPTASVDHTELAYDIFSNSAPASGAQSPMTVALTIDGVTVTLDNLMNAYDAQEHRYVYADGSFSNLFATVGSDTIVDGVDTGGLVQLYVNHYGPAFYTSQDFDNPVDYTVVAGDTGAGSIDFYQFQGNETYYSEAFNASVSRVVVAGVADVTAGVPEPATWALMIMGFGLAGASLRRRKASFA